MKPQLPWIVIFLISSILFMYLIFSSQLSPDTLPLPAHPANHTFLNGGATELNSTTITTNSSNHEKSTQTDHMSFIPAGVTIHDKDQAYLGYTLFTPFQSQSWAVLVDMEGEQVHNWSLADGTKWFAVKPGDNGSIYAAYSGPHGGLIHLDWRSRVIWRVKTPLHHDFDIAENGYIYALTLEPGNFTFNQSVLPTYHEYITVVDEMQQIVQNISLFEVFQDFLTDDYLSYIISNNITWHTNRSQYDLLHSNSLVILPRSIEGVGEKGDLLISLRSMNITAIIDIKTLAVIWQYGRSHLEGQHNPILLEDDNFLIFDNRDQLEQSRIVEVNPKTKEIVWEYTFGEFFTGSKGGNQLLPNGNYLITESNKGRAFEITPNKTIVWSYNVPYLEKNPRRPDELRRVFVYRVYRIPPEHIDPYLKQTTTPAP